MKNTNQDTPNNIDEPKWDELDHLLGHCDCLPVHDYLYLGSDQKQAIATHTNQAVLEGKQEELAKTCLAGMPELSPRQQDYITKRLETLQRELE